MEYGVIYIRVCPPKGSSAEWMLKVGRFLYESDEPGIFKL